MSCEADLRHTYPRLSPGVSHAATSALNPWPVSRKCTTEQRDRGEGWLTPERGTEKDLGQ